MQLKEYLQREGMSASEFAVRIGRAVSTVTGLANGESTPEPETIAKIVEVTGGKVQANDLFAGAVPANSDIAEEDALRAQCYRLLALLLAAPPSAETLALARSLRGDQTPIGRSLDALADAARSLDLERLSEEYHALFIGLGQGELVPFGSYYLTGFLHEKPLAELRGDMARLGIAQAEGVPESEDHIASLCEMMAGLIGGAFGQTVSVAEQRRFFDRHIGCWAPRFFDNLQAAKSAAFYVPVGTLGRLFMDVETQAFDMAA